MRKTWKLAVLANWLQISLLCTVTLTFPLLLCGLEVVVTVCLSVWNRLPIAFVLFFCLLFSVTIRLWFWVDIF